MCGRIFTPGVNIFPKYGNTVNIRPHMVNLKAIIVVKYGNTVNLGKICST